MEKKSGFRGWYYFRQGWSLYFAFILAAINTLTVTYYLAIENLPYLKEIFPTFAHYIISAVLIGVPLLIIVGYTHFKKTAAYTSEASVVFETNPYYRRMVVNTEAMLFLQLRLSELLMKMSNEKNFSDDEKEELDELCKKMNKFVDERTLTNSKDLEFLKKIK